MKRITWLLPVLFCILCKAQSPVTDYPILPVSIKDVVIRDQFWLPKIKTIQTTTIPYGFEKCTREGRFENFLIAGGVMKGMVKGTHPSQDVDVYKIIEGAAYSLGSQPNSKLDAYLDSLIAIIRTGQEPDGYLATWFTINNPNPQFRCIPQTKRWEHEEGNLELYNSGHLYEAAAAHYWATGKRNFLDIAIKNADLLVANFGPGKLRIPPGHEIIETGLVKLYRITRNDKYLDLAKQFLDWRGDASSHKLYGEYSQDHIPVIKQDEAVGHAVRATYLYAGMTDMAAIEADDNYLDAVNRIWDNMVTKKLYLTGGIGSRHGTEAFGNNYELPNRTAYNETCAAIGSVLWNGRMFRLNGDARYYDILERTLYNGLISGLSLDGTSFFYPNPLESSREPVEGNQWGSATRQPWFDVSCCPTNLIRFIPSVPGLIYAHDADNLYVNLYISSVAHVRMGENQIDISQESDYPWDGTIRLSVEPQKRSSFAIKLRIPSWAQGRPVPGDLYAYPDSETAPVVLKVNGKVIEQQMDKGYVVINREWSKGDQVELELPMPVRRVVANKNVVEDRGKIAFERGPIVYCLEGIDNRGDAVNTIVKDNTAVSYTFQKNLLGGVGVLHFNGSQVWKDIRKNTTTISNARLTAVPYFAWSNRGAGTMRVWIPQRVIRLSYDDERKIGLGKWKFKTGDDLAWAKSGFNDCDWKPIKAGINWERQGYAGYNGYAWYRIKFMLPASWKEHTLSDTLVFRLGRIDDHEQTFLNGRLLGENAKLIPASGNVPVKELSKMPMAWDVTREYKVPFNDPRLNWDGENTLAIRVYDEIYDGGIYTLPVDVSVQDFKEYLEIDPKQNGTTSIKNTSLVTTLKGTMTIVSTDLKTNKILTREIRKISLGSEAQNFRCTTSNPNVRLTYTFTEEKTENKTVFTIRNK